MTYQEDKSLVRAGNAPCVTASLRSLAVSLLGLGGRADVAAADRHCARGPRRDAEAASNCVSGLAVSVAAGLPLREARSGRLPPKTGTPGSAAVVEGHLVAVGVGERESAAERPVDGR